MKNILEKILPHHTSYLSGVFLGWSSMSHIFIEFKFRGSSITADVKKKNAPMKMDWQMERIFYFICGVCVDIGTVDTVHEPRQWENDQRKN